MRDLRRALPADESVLLRYIATVVVLLGKVAWADGVVTQQEEANLRALLAHIEGLGSAGVDAVCSALRGKIPSFSDHEMELVYSEIRALCDGAERRQIMRLLVGLAAIDGQLSAPERRELEQIAEELGVPLEDAEGPLDSDPPRPEDQASR